jgi:hypothetical protein
VIEIGPREAIHDRKKISDVLSQLDVLRATSSVFLFSRRILVGASLHHAASFLWNFPRTCAYTISMVQPIVSLLDVGFVAMSPHHPSMDPYNSSVGTIAYMSLECINTDLSGFYQLSLMGISLCT